MTSINAYPGYGQAQPGGEADREVMARFYAALAYAARRYFWGTIISILGLIVIVGLLLLLVGAASLGALATEDPMASMMAAIGAIILVVVVLVVVLALEAYYYYTGSQRLRDTLINPRTPYTLFNLKSAADLLYYGGLIMLIGAVATIILVGILLLLVGYLLFLIGLILLGQNLRNVNPMLGDTGTLLMVGAILSLAAMITSITTYGWVLSLAALVILLVAFHQLANKAEAEARTLSPATYRAL